MKTEARYCAFSGSSLLCRGGLEAVLRAAKERNEAGDAGALLIFDEGTGRQVDFDLRAPIPGAPLPPVAGAEAKAPSPAGHAGPGRPKLGVVSGEVTLLPRHWEWLAKQPLKASGTIRRLVEEAMTKPSEAELARKRRDAAGAFLWSIAGDLPGFEEASRDLYAGRTEELRGRMSSWPADIADEALRLLEGGV